MQSIHRSVGEKSDEYKEQLRRYNYVTPTSYLELLNVFKFLLHEKRTEVGGLRSKLQYGLDTLASAGEDIARLQIDLREKEPRLVETQKEVELTMQQIAIDRRDAAVTKEIVERQEADAASKAAECKEIRDDAQGELDRALPMLDKAVESLRELNKTHIDEVRNFKKPPSGVILTMEAAWSVEFAASGVAQRKRVVRVGHSLACSVAVASSPLPQHHVALEAEAEDRHEGRRERHEDEAGLLGYAQSDGVAIHTYWLARVMLMLLPRLLFLSPLQTRLRSTS